ncbi:MAG: hypothetical protein JNK67_08535 [Alphaproteobacteria bacterium]|nr:hypothetical protein [Alphaproteobacteria bacterium]
MIEFRLQEGDVAKRANRCAAIVALLAAMAGGTAAQQNWRPVTVAEMQREIAGKPMKSRMADRSEATFRLRPDNKVEVRGNRSLDGTWRVSDKGDCTIYPNVRGGAEACFEIIRRPDGAFEVYDQKGEFQGRMAPQ